MMFYYWFCKVWVFYFCLEIFLVESNVKEKYFENLVSEENRVDFFFNFVYLMLKVFIWFIYREIK